MSTNNRVVMTGFSALTASGLTADETWQSILAGQQSIDEIKQWDLSNWTHRLGGELKQYKPAAMLPDRKLLKVISRQDVLGINAAVQAVEHSQLLNYRQTLACSQNFNDNTAVFVASPGNKYYQQYDFLPLIAKTGADMQAFAGQLFNEVHPTWLLRILPNNVLAYTGITYGFKGMNHNIANHAVGGMQAIIEAYHAIKTGLVDRAVVVAYDVGIEPQALFYYEKLGVLSATDLKPFDAHHDGTILAEGACAIVLESEASALERQATCYAEITAGLSATESEGLFSIQESGEHLASLMQQTLAKQSISPEAVGFLVAHGNGNQKSDVSEAAAIHQVFAHYPVPITAFKWAMGHTLCASGVLDAVLASYVLRSSCLPGIANLTQLADSCKTLNATAQTQSLQSDKPYALLINRGFGSMNACLLMKAYE